MTKEEDDAVKAVDRMEDEEEEKREKASEGFKEKDSDEVIICPKCKLLVTEADFKEDEVSEMGADSIASKITCPNCGYTGIPVEVPREEYVKFGKKP
jgi:rubrerythrin